MFAQRIWQTSQSSPYEAFPCVCPHFGVFRLGEQVHEFYGLDGAGGRA